MKESSIYSSIEEIEHLGHDSNSGKKKDPKQPYEENQARVYIGKSLAPFANVMFQRALKNRGGFGFCSLKVIA